VAPAAVTNPVLAHPLLPEVTELEPGDAAQMYLTACLLSAQARAKAASEAAQEVGAGAAVAGAERPGGVVADTAVRQGARPPPQPAEEESARVSRLLFLQSAELPRDEAQALVERYRAALELLDAAARRDSCRWDLPPKGRGFRADLPHLPELSFLVSVLSLDARLQSLDGRPDAALRRLRTGMAVVRHLAQEPTLVQASGAAFATQHLMLAVGDLAGSRSSPNLYWSLASLPKPLVDTHAVARWERSMLELTAPGIDRALTGQLAPQQWDELMTRLRETKVLPETRGDRSERFISGAVSTARAYVLAKRDLATRPAFDASQLDALPVEYVIGVWQYARYRDWTDELWSQFQLPMPAAYPRLQRTTEALRESVEQEGFNPFLTLVPQVQWTRFTLERGERNVAVMQAVEALRDYTASHDGRLPKSLAGVDGLLPVPNDPATGERFAYAVEADGRSATIRLVAPPESPARVESFHLTVVVP
jgi:hypothetical protein